MTLSSRPETPARCGLTKPKAGEGILAREADLRKRAARTQVRQQQAADTPLDRTRALQRLREGDRSRSTPM